MRVTFGALYSGIEAVNAAAERYVRAHTQVETGKRLQVASDDPGAMRRAINGRAEIGAIDSYTRTSDGAGARLAILDTVLTDIVDKITQAQGAAASVRGSTATQSARDAAAARLEGLRDSLAADINMSFRGTHLFSGGEVQTEAYALVAGAWTYQGDNTPVTVDVGQNRSVSTALDGHEIFQGSDSTDVLTTLDALITAAQTGDQTALSDGMDALSRAFERAVRAQSRVGADEQGIEAELERLTAFKLAAATNVSKDEDANLAQAVSELTQADAAYRAALGAMGTTTKVSLLDYLR